MDESALSIKAYPNPFADKLELSIDVLASGQYSIQLFNAKGIVVANIYEGNLNKGVNIISYNSTKLANGIYFCKIVHDKFKTKEIKLIRLK